MKLEPNTTTTVLAFDPAPKNHGYAVFTARTNKDSKITKITLLKAGKLSCTIHTPNVDVILQQANFSSEVRRLFNRYKPAVVCLERFLSRGRGGALTAEASNLQIGSILEIARSKKVPANIVLAVTWKAKAKKQLTGGLDVWYALNKKCLHPIDAFLIGAFFIEGFAILNTATATNTLTKKRLRAIAA